MPKHRRTPSHVGVNWGNIGVLPSSAKCGVPLLESYKYLTFWLKDQQIFNFSAQYQDDSNTPNTGNYYFVTKRPACRDPGVRELGGALLPWRIEGANTSTWNDVPHIKFTSDTESIVTLKEYKQGGTIVDADKYWGTDDGDTCYGASIPRPYPIIDLYHSSYFRYEPDGTYQVHNLETKNIIVAALGIWEMPDRELTLTEQHIDRSKFFPNKPIKTDLFYDTGYVSASHDGTIANTSRCLFQFGHPIGYHFDGTLGSRARINFFDSSDALTGSADHTVKIRDDHLMAEQEHAAELVAVVTTIGATESNPAIIHYYSFETGDSCTETITSDITTTVVSGSTLDIQGNDEIAISVTPPGTTTSHHIIIHTLALFTDWSDY